VIEGFLRGGNGNSTVLPNVGIISHHCTGSQPRRPRLDPAWFTGPYL